MKHGEILKRVNFIVSKVTRNIVLFYYNFSAEVVTQKLGVTLLLRKKLCGSD
jgi:hypothetical protein